MAEQFRINRSFGDSPAVYSDILSVLSAAVLMDNLRKTLLTHTTLSGNQHRQISRSYLNGDINSTHQSLVIANNTKTQFYLLYFCSGDHICAEYFNEQR